MKTQLLALFVLISTSLFAQEREVRELPVFDEVNLNTSGTVYITQGAIQKVELVGSDETLEKIETEVRGGRLVIKTQNSGWFSWNDIGRFEIYITMKDIRALHVAGSGRMFTENKLSVRDLDLAVSGSGKLEVQADASYIDASISGSGKMEIEGQAPDLEIHISGSGGIYAENLSSKNCEVRISGSGRCEVNVSDELNARISGSGSVYYTGNPQRLDSSTSGSGRVRKMS